MAAKKKSQSQNPSSRNKVGANPKGMNMKGEVVWNNPKPSAAFTKPGQKAKDLAPGAGKGVPKISGKGDKKVFSGTGTPTGTSFGLSKPTKPSNIAKAIAAGAAVGAGAGLQITKKYVVSEATKKLQRELSKEMKSRSDKDVRSLPKAKRERVIEGRRMQDDMSPEEIAEDRAYVGQLRSDISKSMKKTTKVRKTVKKRV